MKRAQFARLGCSAALVSAGLVFGAAAVNAAQPVIPTPAGIARLPNIVYVIPYAVSASPAGATSQAETIVSINATGAAAVCTFQVEWVDFAGATAGLSGGAGIVAPPGGTYEYTTTPNGGAVLLFPFQQNVFRNTAASFEGYANVRSNCAASIKTGIDAEFFVVDGTSGDKNYRQIEPIRRAGNAGE